MQICFGYINGIIIANFYNIVKSIFIFDIYLYYILTITR